MRALTEKVTLRDRIVLYGDFTMPEGEITLQGESFEFCDENFKITSATVSHPTGVYSRRDTVKNVSGKTLTVRGALSRFVYTGGEYEVYTQYNEWCGESDGAWAPLVNEVSASIDEARLNMSVSPFVALRSLQSDRGVVFHILAKSAWQFRINRLFTQRSTKTVEVELGINTRNLSITLNPGEELVLPEIIYYSFKNKKDLDAYKLHRYYNKLRPAKSLPVVYNTWMADYDASDFDFLCKQLDVAKRLGIEYFVVDAGWFGGPEEWFDRVGDWQESPKSKIGGRLFELSECVRKAGLKFGLWFEIERATLTSKAYTEHPEFYFTDHGQAFVDFANPKAVDYIVDAISSQIEKYGVKYIKSDYNAAPYCDVTCHSFIEYFKGYEAFNERLRAKHPDLYIENCAGGGGRLGLYSLDCFESCWMSDNHSLYKQLDIFKDTLKRMPSRSLETWITVASVKDYRKDRTCCKGDKLIVSGDAGWEHVEAIQDSFLREVVLGGPIGFSCDLTDINEAKLTLLQEIVAEFKAEREFWLNSEAHILVDTESMLVIQYNDEEFNTIKISVFTKIPHQTEIIIYPVAESGTYIFNGKEYTGELLDEEGILIDIGKRYTASRLEIKRKQRQEND